MEMYHGQKRSKGMGEKRRFSGYDCPLGYGKMG
jgi:hypothetical protein